MAHRREGGRGDQRDRRPGRTPQGADRPIRGWSRSCRSSPASTWPPGATSRSAVTRSAKPRSSPRPSSSSATTTPSTAIWLPAARPTSTSSTRTRVPARLSTSAGRSKTWPMPACASSANRRGPRSSASRRTSRSSPRPTVSTSSSSSIWLRPSPPSTSRRCLPPGKSSSKLLDKPEALPAGGQLALCDCRPRPGLSVHQLHAVARLGTRLRFASWPCDRETCHMGHDGKTGETLLKSVLAPMFAARNLQVMSWVGHNIFGNMDGKVLDDPANKRTKVTSKDRLLRQILGYKPQTLVSIEYIESLGDWKTAWDHIHFRGFLGTPMIMQFTWQGCDSLLAAPLVIDLVRLTELRTSQGRAGALDVPGQLLQKPAGRRRARFRPAVPTAPSVGGQAQNSGRLSEPAKRRGHVRATPDGACGCGTRVCTGSDGGRARNRIPAAADGAPRPRRRRDSRGRWQGLRELAAAWAPIPTATAFNRLSPGGRAAAEKLNDQPLDRTDALCATAASIFDQAACATSCGRSLSGVGAGAERHV